MAGEKKKAGKPASRRNAKQAEDKPEKTSGGRLKDEIWAIIIIALGVFLVIAFQTNAAGQLGGAVKTLFFGSFGFVAYLLPYYLMLFGILLFAKKAAHIGGRSILLLILIYFMFAILNASRFIDPEHISYALFDIFDASVALDSGGVIGMIVGNALVQFVGKSGLFIFSFVVMLISILLVINTPISQFFDKIKQKRAEKRAQRENEYDDEDAEEMNEAQERVPERAPEKAAPEPFLRTQEKRRRTSAGVPYYF